MTTSRYWTGLVAGIALLLPASSARASSFTLTQPSYPDLAGYFVSITYTHSTGILTACGYTAALSESAVDNYVADSVPCQYSLTALISQPTLASPVTFTANNAPTYSPSGSSESITAGLPTYDTQPSTPGLQDVPDNSLLMDANLTDFQYTAGSKSTGATTVLQFLGAVMDDPQHLGFGSLAGVVLTTTDIYAANFFKDFSGHGYIDTFAQSLTLATVPEPATLTLLGTGIALLIRRRHAQKRVA